MSNETSKTQKNWFMIFNKEKAKQRNQSVGINWQNPVVYIEAGFKNVLTGDIGDLIDAEIGDNVFIYQSSAHIKGIYGIGKIVDILYSKEDTYSRYAVITLEYSGSKDKPIVSLYDEFYDMLYSRICSARRKWGYTTLSDEEAKIIMEKLKE